MVAPAAMRIVRRARSAVVDNGIAVSAAPCGLACGARNPVVPSELRTCSRVLPPRSGDDTFNKTGDFYERVQQAPHGN